MKDEKLNLELLELKEKIENRREIYFSLNDYLSGLDKVYYFTFVCNKSGYVKIKVKKPQEKIGLSINDVTIISDKEFYLKKGTYQVKVVANLLTEQTINIVVSGYVKYYDNAFVKVLNSTNYSVIAVQNLGEVSLYKYNGEIELIETISTSSFDFCLDTDEVVLFYLTDNGFVKKTYMQNFNASVVQETFVKNLSEIKCYNGQKVGLYGVKQGVLCKIDADNGEITNLNIKAKNVLAGKEDCFVFRDFDNKIKLCNLSVSQTK